MGDYLRAKMAAKASETPDRATARADLITARRRFYAAGKACDAALKMETGEMIEAAQRLLCAAERLPDACPPG